MMKYKKITFKQYKNIGDICVLADYEQNTSAIGIANKLKDTWKKPIIFNLRPELKEKLKGDISEIYVDEKAEPSVNYIVEKCYELSRKIHDFIVIVDSKKPVNYNKEGLTSLKNLAKELHTHFIFTLDINMSDKIPVLEDIKNDDLSSLADVVFLMNDKESILAKNEYGKIGILK